MTAAPRTFADDAGIVAKNANAAKGVLNGLNAGFNGLFIGDIHDVNARSATFRKQRGGFIQPLLVEVH